VTSRTTRHADGSVDLEQSGTSSWSPPAGTLERLYWDEVRRTTLGLVRFSRNSIRVAGIWPVLIRFGPMVDGGRPIVGGLFARRPQGHIHWSADGGRVVVAVDRFAPLMRGPFWRVESWFHGLVGRRFLDRAARGED